MGITWCWIRRMVGSGRLRMPEAVVDCDCNADLTANTGTVTEYKSTGDSYPPTYESHDPGKWRDRCDDRTFRLSDFLSEWKERYQNLEWIALPLNGWPHLWVADDSSTPEEIQEVQVRCFARVCKRFTMLCEHLSSPIFVR